MKKLFTAFMIATLLLALAACSTKNDDVITIGVDDSYPPMEFRNENNELVGFDVDFAEALAAEMGVEIEFIPTGWDGIFSGLEADKYDMIISSVSITNERLEGFEFSKPYLANGQVIVVAPGDDSVKSAADLAGKNVGVQLGTTADEAVEKQMAKTPFEITKYDDITQTFADMKTGRLQAIVVDYAVAIDYVSKNPDDYVITTAQLTNEPIGVCIKKGNTDLKDQVNEALAKLQSSNSLVAISQEWLGGDYVSNIDEELR